MVLLVPSKKVVYFYIILFVSEKLQLDEAEKERKRQEALRIEQEQAEQRLKFEQAEKEKELATQNPENACPALPKV